MTLHSYATFTVSDEVQRSTVWALANVLVKFYSSD